MASMPLPALDVKSPDLMEGIQKALAIRSMIFGQQLGAAELQQKNLSNEQLAATLDGMTRLRAAQNDPAWNPTDTDAATKLLQHYQVPLDVAGKVIAGIGQIRQGLQQQSSENIGNIKNAHDFLDDQLQATKNAPLDKRQSAYEDGITNAKNYANMLPDGHAKALFLSEIAGAPPIYDASWVNQKHVELRTMAQLAEAGLKDAQTREAAGKGAQSEAEAAKITGSGTPGSPWFAPTPQATALGAETGVPWAAAVNKGEAAQAGAKADAEAAAKFPYEKQLEQLRQQTALQLSTNKDAQDKIEGTVLKPYEEKMTSIAQLQSTVQQASQGNVTAARGVALKLIGVTNPEGTKRYNEAEAERMISQGNVPERIKGTLKNLLTGDNWTDKMQNDMMSFGDAQANVAKANLNRGIANVNRLYGTNVGQGLLQNTAGNTVKMKAPDGTVKDVPAEQVDHYKSLGATVVQQ